MAKNIRPDHKKFADEWLKTGNGKQSIKKVRPHLKDNSAESTASRLLRNDKVMTYIQAQALQSAMNMGKLANSGKHDTVTLQANKDILDRAGYKPSVDDKDNQPTRSTADAKAHLDTLLNAIKRGDDVELQRIILRPKEVE